MYRRYVMTDDSRPLPHVVAVVAFVVSVGLLIMVITVSRLFGFLSEYLALPIGFLVVAVVLSVIGLIWTWRIRERVSWLDVDDMHGKAQKRASRVLRLFSDKTITDVLGFSIKTRYGQEMPVIRVWVADDLTVGYVAIENLGNFDALDRAKLEQRVSGILAGKYAKYAVVASDLTVGDTYVRFWFEDVKTSHRLTVRNGDVSDFVSDDVHTTKLMDNLSLRWGYDTHHLSIIARTRSGKTKLAQYLALLMEKQGWIVEYSSAKHDVNVDRFHGYSDPLEIVERAEYWVGIMNERLAAINLAGKETYLQMDNMPDVALYWDELGNLWAALNDVPDKKAKARWSAAINRLSATGASAGLHNIGISQLATLEGLGLPNLARTNMSDSVIMLRDAANSGDERRYMMSGFADLPKRKFGVGQGLARFVGLGGLWETPHLFEAPWIEE